ncbi:hypothetical protein EMIT07CA2_550142 [Brevibacillus sp. IT-7CA2]
MNRLTHLFETMQSQVNVQGTSLQPHVTTKA